MRGQRELAQAREREQGHGREQKRERRETPASRGFGLI